KAHNIGSMNVFTIRNVFGNPPRLKEVITDLKRRKLIDEDDESDGNPLGWLIDADVNSLVEAGYRFAAYSEGVTTVMCGCIDAKRLEENSRSIQKGPLP